jgi:hypothetical protein
MKIPEFTGDLKENYNNILEEQCLSILDSILKEDYDYEHWQDTDSVFLCDKGYLKK